MHPKIILGLAVVVVIILMLGGLCIPATPSAELARTTREAVGLARDAVAQGASADRLRLLAIVLGVSIPVIVAFLIWRSSARDELDTTEVIEVLDRFELPLPPDTPASLSSTSSASLERPGEC